MKAIVIHFKRNSLAVLSTLIILGHVQGQQLIPLALTESIEGNDGDFKVSSVGTDDEYFYLFGSTAMSSTDDIKDFSATGSMNAIIIPHKHYALNIAWNNVGINPEKIKRDSVDLTKLMFPDAGNTGLLAAIYWRAPIRTKSSQGITPRSKWRIGPYFEFSLRNSRVDLSTIDTTFIDSVYSVATTIEETAFTSLNYNLGLRLEWTYVSKKKKEDIVQISLSPYYNFFNIPNEDAASFYRTMDKEVPEKSILRRTEIHSFGTKLALSFRGFSLFADVRYNAKNKKFNLEGTNLEGTVFSIGTCVAVKAISF